MKHRQIAVGLAASLLLLTACGQAGTPGAAESGPAAVTVNGQAISTTVFDLYLGTVSQQPAESIPAEQKVQLLDQLVAMHLAAEAAQKAGLDKGKDVQAQLELTRLNVLADAQFKKMIADAPVTDADVEIERAHHEKEGDPHHVQLDPEGSFEREVGTHQPLNDRLLAEELAHQEAGTEKPVQYGRLPLNETLVVDQQRDRPENQDQRARDQRHRADFAVTEPLHGDLNDDGGDDDAGGDIDVCQLVGHEKRNDGEEVEQQLHVGCLVES